MTELQIAFDWEDPAGARGPGLRATWARLEIAVGGRPVTRVFDSDNRTVRDYIYTPLLPIAEWFASNWWSLLFEAQNSTPRQGFADRHNLRFAGEGFALPHLELLPDGRLTTLQWRPWRSTDARVSFLEAGTASIESVEFESCCRSFIESVLDRLRLLEVEQTYLDEEWARIVNASDDEVEFCRAAAALGVDPFAAGEQEANSILRAHDELAGQPVLEQEFYLAADLGRLGNQLRQLKAGTCDLAATGSSWRLDPLPVAVSCAPWEQGYQLAAEFRQRLGIKELKLSNFAQLVDKLAVGGKAPPILRLASEFLFDALVHENIEGNMAFALDLKKKSDDVKSFALCRAVCEALVNGKKEPTGTRLITTSQTARQKRNRAFAAEFLAPSDLLRQEITSRVVGSDVIEALAEDFGVSPLVIQHQLENHDLVEEILP